MAHYEIEIKTLLGEAQKADALKKKMYAFDPKVTCISTNKQLNHYFEGGDIYALYEKTRDLFSEKIRKKFKQIVKRGSDFSVRTRQKDDEVLLVVKASIDGGTSANAVSRLEFEEPVSTTLDEIDQKVQSAGFTYQAKWSRKREEYRYKNIRVCFDCNAGYGYLAEFEKVVDDETHVKGARDELTALMIELGVQELPQDRLERMFQHYNKNWMNYYGTEKTFVIE